ncbi:Exocyst complex component 3 [Clonorchis sinensis]|uniref:Exocyst complex component 3 n=1 Tax=Clonorchis sinensis TaxID=79923 RepID=A0A8T1M1M5_CLOSI|nr:Exocyst complex component 3 [Clonorchis sinensis]
MSKHLAELEYKARLAAGKQVAELFQKPEQLEKLDLIRSRFVNQKMATEAQLKMTLHSQLDGSKIGLEKLDSAMKEAQSCRIRLFELASALESLEGLPNRLLELKNISRKYSQLAAAMENMTYLVKAPEAMEQAHAYVEGENLLEAHKILQELEGIRDELMSEVHPEHSKTDLETLRAYFRGVDELNQLFVTKISMIGSRITSAVITQHRFVVDCVRVIDREERADAIWEKRSEKTQFIPHGRPKQWKKLLLDSISKAIRDKVFASAMDSDGDKNKLVRHNEAIRQHALADLKIAKNICPTYFPPDYNIFDRFVEMYHNAIGAHVEAMVMEGLTDTQIVQLLGWINSYHTEEFMKEPAFDINFSRLTLKYPINLLPENQLDALREQYISKTIERLCSWLTNSLTKDASDWRRPVAPEMDGSSYYFTGLPVLLMTPLNEMIGKGNLLNFLGSSVRERFLVKCVDQMSYFVGEYDNKLKQYHMAYLQDRSKFRFYIEYILANANNALVIAESFMSVVMQELAEDVQLKGRLQSQLNHLKGQFGIVTDHCRLAAEETVLMDMINVMNNVMTPQWLRPDDITANCFSGTLADYDETLHHVRPSIYEQLVNHLAERVLIEYIKVLLTRRCVFRSDSERHQAGEKILRDGESLKCYFHDTMKVSEEVSVAYGALAAIAQFFLTTDACMLSLDIANIVREFPDVRGDQLYCMLMARGDIRPNIAKELASDDPNQPEGRTKPSPLNLFTKIADAMRR